MNKLSTLLTRYMPLIVTCEEANRFIDDYLSNELPRRQSLIFERHIRLCTECRKYLEHYRRAIDLCRKNFYGEEYEDAVPEKLLDGVITAKCCGSE